MAVFTIHSRKGGKGVRVWSVVRTPGTLGKRSMVVGRFKTRAAAMRLKRAKQRSKRT